MINQFNMKNLLSATNHCIKKGSILKLRHKTFPHPPFYDYRIIQYDSGINVELESEPLSNHNDGKSINHTKYFIFPNKGNYEIRLKSMLNDNNILQLEEMEKCFQINVG